MRRMKSHNFLLIGFLVLAVFYVTYLAVSFAQIANEKEKCTHTPLDTMSREDFQYCIGLKK